MDHLVGVLVRGDDEHLVRLRVDDRRRRDAERVDVAATDLPDDVRHRRADVHAPQHATVVRVERVHRVVLGRGDDAAGEHDRLAVDVLIEVRRPRLVRGQQRRLGRVVAGVGGVAVIRRPRAAGLRGGTLPADEGECRDQRRQGRNGDESIGGKASAQCYPLGTLMRAAREQTVKAFSAERVPRMAAVDVADERRTDVVPEQLLQPFGQPGDDVARHREHVVLDRPQPRGRVVEHDADARCVGVVGAAAVPEAPDVEQRRARGHLDDGDLVVGPGLPVGPAVAAGTMRVAPLSAVKSSRGHMTLTTSSGVRDAAPGRSRRRGAAVAPPRRGRSRCPPAR